MSRGEPDPEGLLDWLTPPWLLPLDPQEGHPPLTRPKLASNERVSWHDREHDFFFNRRQAREEAKSDAFLETGMFYSLPNVPIIYIDQPLVPLRDRQPTADGCLCQQPTSAVGYCLSYSRLEFPALSVWDRLFLFCLVSHKTPVGWGPLRTVRDGPQSSGSLLNRVTNKRTWGKPEGSLKLVHMVYNYGGGGRGRFVHRYFFIVDPEILEHGFEIFRLC